MTAIDVSSPASANSVTPVAVVRIRPMRESDITTLVEHSEHSRDFYLTALSRTDWSERKLRVFVAEVSETGEIAGRATVGLGYPSYFPKLDDENVKQLYLAGIEVMPAHQRRGIGLKLLQFLRREAEMLELDVFRAECTKGWLVNKFYAKIGLEPVPYTGSHEAYPDSHQMLELWFDKSSAVAALSS